MVDSKNKKIRDIELKREGGGRKILYAKKKKKGQIERQDKTKLFHVTIKVQFLQRAGLNYCHRGDLRR